MSKTKKPTEQMFDVFNLTDGVFASREPMTETDADIFIATFPDRYAHQGYYLTAGRQRINPKDVKLRKIRNDNAEDFAQAMRDRDTEDSYHGPE